MIVLLSILKMITIRHEVIILNFFPFQYSHLIEIEEGESYHFSKCPKTTKDNQK